MSFQGVLSKRNTALLKILSRNIADVTFIFFISHKTVVFSSETGKSIEHNTRNDITKKHAKESYVDHIIDKPKHLESRHCLTDCS